MAAKGGIEWVITPPAGFGDKLAHAGDAFPAAGHALASSHAARGEAAMKGGAPWTDRSGNARQGLYGQADGLTIELGGTASYQPYLETGTSKMAPRPIIKPTADALAPEYFEDAAELATKLLGGG